VGAGVAMEGQAGLRPARRPSLVILNLFQDLGWQRAISGGPETGSGWRV